MAKLLRTFEPCCPVFARNVCEQLRSSSVAKGSRRNRTSSDARVCYSTTANDDGHARMRAWQISRFQEAPDLTLSHDTLVPKIQQPDDVLIEVSAASINPLDTWMAKGYGRNVLKTVKQTTGIMFSDTACDLRAQTTFPITLGRDFSGVIAEAGPNVRKFKVGDAVYGTVAAHRPGSHAEYTVTSAGCIGRKPADLTDVEAASLPWVACTAYSALVYSGGIPPGNASQRNVLIIGASGGLGNFAVQLLRAWNAASVTALVRGQSQALHVQSLHAADQVIDSNDPDFLSVLEQCGPFDVLLDAAGNAETTQQCASFLRKNLSSRFVTLTSPLLKNADQYSLVPGTALSAIQLAKKAVGALSKGYQYHWAFYIPNGEFLNGNLRQLIAEQTIKPVIQEEFGFSEIPNAFHTMSEGSSKGKIVVNMKRENMHQGFHAHHRITGKQKKSTASAFA